MRGNNNKWGILDVLSFALQFLQYLRVRDGHPDADKIEHVRHELACTSACQTVAQTVANRPQNKPFIF